MNRMNEENRIEWPKLLIGLVAVFALFQWTATALGSDRGQFGVIVGLIVAGAMLLVERLLFGVPFREAFRTVGLTLPDKKGILTVIVLSVLMFSAVFVFALATDTSFGLYPNWYLLIIGLFFQAGVAEEILFRGYLFGHIRRKHAFWKAAGLAAVPFILVHLILLYTLPPAFAAASIFLSVVMSFPLARLYEAGGRTIWPAAILHFVVQGTVKVLVASGASGEYFPLFWIAVCALIPLLVFIPGKHMPANEHR